MEFRIQTPDQLSAHLVALREAAGLTQKQLADKLEIGQPRIAKIEKSPLSVSVQTLLKILGMLNAQVVIDTSALTQKQGEESLDSHAQAGRVRKTKAQPSSATIARVSAANALKSGKGKW